MSLNLGDVHEIVKNTDTTRGAAAAYRQLLIASDTPMNEEIKTAVKSAKVRIRDLALLRCDCEVGSQNKESYFDALTAAFGSLLDEVPNLRSQLKLAYHKVINNHPSKNQIETDKRGSQRPGRRRSTSCTRRQDRMASSSSVTVAAAVAHVPQCNASQPANHESSCCASAAVEDNMTPQHAHAPQRDAAQTANHQSSCCASTTVEDNVTLPHPAIHPFRLPPGLENEVSRNEFPMMMLPPKCTCFPMPRGFLAVLAQITC